MKLKWLLSGVLIVVVGLCGATLYALSQMRIQQLISCSTNEGGTQIPADICEYYMVNYRMTDKDIESLSQGAGLDYILNAESPDKYRIAKVFIANGLDVNGVNHYSDKDVTPLHAAVLYNDPERVRFLLGQGADASIVSEGYGGTPLELAKRLDAAHSEQDRSSIVEMLSNTDTAQAEDQPR